MPSPVLHSFAGLALEGLMPKAPERRDRLFLLGALVVAANAPDFDFLPGILVGDAGRFHRGISHTWIAIVVFTAGAIAMAYWIKHRSPLRLGLLLGLAFAGHLFLDIFSSWVDPRSGVPLGWPFTDARLLSPIPLFVGISLAPRARNFFEGVFHLGNLYAMLWELLIAGVIWGFVRLIRAPR